MKKIRRLAGALALLCVCIGVMACGRGGTRVVFTTGFGKDEVFRIEDEVCKKDEMMVYLTTVQNQYESVYGEQIWNTSLDGVTLEENIKETVLARIAQVKTMYLLALDKGISLTEKEEKQVKQAAEKYFQSLNETEITEMEVSQETIEKLYRESAMADKVYRDIISEVNPEISDDEARTVTVQHILVKTSMTDGTGKDVAYGANVKRATYSKACEIQQMAVSGEYDFLELASRYSEDTEITKSFGKGEVSYEMENAAFRLETDEVSQVIEDEWGYHIIKCINTLDRTQTDANKLKLVEERRREVFNQEYDLFLNSLAHTLNQELWEKIELIHNDAVTTSDFFEVYESYVKGNFFE